MKFFSLKKTFVSAFLVAGALLSACGTGEPSESTTAEVVNGTTAATLSPSVATTGSDDPEAATSSSVPENVNHAVTWSLSGDVEASDKIEYELPEPDELYAEKDIFYNYLSGIETEETDTLGIRRVTAVCLNNNYSASRFQSGTSEADVIFEIPMDYNVTTLLALYYHPNGIAKIGPVRSAVPAAVTVAEGYDAYLLHNGTIGGASSYIDEYKTDHLDSEDDSAYDCFFSDTAIGSVVSYAYSMFSTSARITKSLIMLNNEGSHFITDPIYRTPFAFNDEFTTPIGNSAKRVRVFFGGFQPYFLYNENTGLYERYQHGGPHNDLNTGEILSFENVIVMYADNEYKNNHLAYNIEGFGTGLYASGGKYVNITWSKASAEEPLLFFDALGNVLNINKGSTFITVCSGKNSVSIS